jgi:hypothetical protein
VIGVHESMKFLLEEGTRIDRSPDVSTLKAR